ncbi:hypothetical protein D3C75_742680 [compost metagenome]
MHAVQHPLVFQRCRPVTEGVGGGEPAGIEHDRRVRVLFANGRYQLPIQGRQITRTVLLPCIPLLHLPRVGMLGQATLLLRGGLVDQVVGGDGRVTFQLTGQIPPEGRSLQPVAFVLPEAVVELALVVLRPAHAG